MDHLQIEPANVRVSLLDWQKAGLTYTATGYGSKIPTCYMVRVGNRWRRVYSTCYSNAGTAWIVDKGQRIVVDFETI